MSTSERDGGSNENDSLVGWWLHELAYLRPSIQTSIFVHIKVTVYVGTDQNIEIEIFAENKYTLNELLVTKIVFQYV